MARDIITKARLEGGEIRTKANIGNTVYGTEVHSVNGKAGHVVLSAEDVGALPYDTPIPSLDGYATLVDIPTDVSAFNNDAGYLTEHQDISGKADIEDIPTKTSDLTNDSGFLTQHQDLSAYALKSTVYTKTQIDTALSEKSDKATTLSGYGIADAYTKTEVDSLIGSRVVAGSGLSSTYASGTLTLSLNADNQNKIDTLWDDYQSAINAIG